MPVVKNFLYVQPLYEYNNRFHIYILFYLFKLIMVGIIKVTRTSILCCFVGVRNPNKDNDPCINFQIFMLYVIHCDSRPTHLYPV